MKRLRFGIAGIGGQGRKHLCNCLRSKDIDVVAVADYSKFILSRVSPLRIKIYKDYQSMISKEELDAVIIALPNHLHEDCSILAAEAGCDILVEKPLSRNFEEGKRIADKTRKTGTRLMVGMCHRFIKSCQKLKTEIETGALGRIDFASGLFFTGPFFTGRKIPDWMFDPAKAGGGALLDAGCHIIDMFIWFFGDIHSISGHTESLFNLGYDDYAEVLIRFRNGVNTFTVASWRTRIPSYRIEVAGELGRRTAMSKKFSLFDIGFGKALPSFVKESISHRIRGRPFLPMGDEIHYDELAYFVKCIIDDVEPRPNADDWLKVAEIIDFVYNSERERNENTPN